MYQVTLRRTMSQNRDQRTGLQLIATRAVAGDRSSWVLSSMTQTEPSFTDGVWVHTASLQFEKVRGHTNNQELVNREWQRILAMIEEVCNNSYFNKYPWRVVNATNMNEHPDIAPEERQQETDEEITPERAASLVAMHVPQVQVRPIASGVRHAIYNDEVASFDTLKDRTGALIDELLASDEALSQNEHFCKIFGRNAQIRTILSSVKSFFESNGQRRNHALLYGLPACAKTQILTSVANLLGEDAVLRLDATSTTSAGIYKLFFNELETIPPIVLIEEIEKTSEEALRVWLGALDDRGELRKVNAREMKVREIQILCLATANDKEAFDGLMKNGGSSKQPGALSSRFVHQLECPRPDRAILTKILMRDIRQNGGRELWIEPAIRLAEAIGTNDPRKVLAFLDGGERLLTGEYQRDILTICGRTELIDSLLAENVNQLERVVGNLQQAEAA